MKSWLPCPLSSVALERFRLNAGRQSRQDLLGGHLMRRKGASLEFHEYTAYQPGDDIRRVDWSASARSGEEGEWLVRRFAAEERTRIVLSLDTSLSMRLPHALSKLQVGLWLLESLSVIGMHCGDHLTLHRLFGDHASGIKPMKSKQVKQLRNCLWSWADEEIPSDSPFNGRHLRPHLPPASIWVIVTDLYAPIHKAMVEAMVKAQLGLRWLILIDLDSWPMERQALGLGAKRLLGPQIQDAMRAYEITPDTLDPVQEKIRQHKQHFLDQVNRSAFSMTRWQWPLTSEVEPGAFFRDRFLQDRVLSSMFQREP